MRIGLRERPPPSTAWCLNQALTHAARVGPAVPRTGLPILRFVRREAYGTAPFIQFEFVKRSVTEHLR